MGVVAVKDVPQQVGDQAADLLGQVIWGAVARGGVRGTQFSHFWVQPPPPQWSGGGRTIKCFLIRPKWETMCAQLLFDDAYAASVSHLEVESRVG